jgi:exodeoxyribonuclease VII large subunit
MPPDPVSLSALNRLVKERINNSFPGLIWVIAEISDMNTNRTGHCYLELIEKSEKKDVVIAKARGTIWSFTFRMIKPYFEDATGQTLKAGMKVLFKASVEFHEIYGFSLNIKDIDPNYTLGDIERKKRETISKLESEGVIDMNKNTHLPSVPQRIAIISSPTAAGYQDFVHQLNNNQEGFKIYHHLFPAIVQGDTAVSSIISTFDKIYKYETLFDAVVLIRGGGSASDLMCFDDYELAYYITQFPLPVLTGIGHERDISVADMVAHTHLKTPTAVAEFIIQKITDFYLYLEGLQNAFIDITSRKINDNKHRLELVAQKITPLVVNSLDIQINRIENLAGTIKRATQSFVNINLQNLNHKHDLTKYLTIKTLKGKRQSLDFYNSKLQIESKSYFKSKVQKLQLLERSVSLSDPVNILNKGYSITYKNNKIIKTSSGLNPGDKIVTTIKDGVISSTVDKIKED